MSRAPSTKKAKLIARLQTYVPLYDWPLLDELAESNGPNSDEGEDDPLAIARRWKDEPLTSFAPRRTFGILARALLAAQQSAGADDARDAARYRFIRDRSDPDMEQPYISRHKVNSWGKWFNTCDRSDYADKVIDAAMSKPDATPET